MLDTIHDAMLEKARKHRDAHTYTAAGWDEFVDTVNNKPGFVKAMWCGCLECEEKIKEVAGATSRCIPFEMCIRDRCGSGHFGGFGRRHRMRRRKWFLCGSV